MLEWSDSARFALSKFYEDVNDIDVYIEDTDPTTARIFSALLTRAFDSTLRIDTVFGLGGRNEVVRRYSEDGGGDGRARLYIVDGDFSCVSADEPCHLIPTGIFRMARYCIENYLVDAGAFIEVAYDEDGHRPREELADAATFDEWLSEIGEQLLTLFASYGAAESLGLGLTTVGRPLEFFARDAEGRIDPARVHSTVNELREAADTRFGAGIFDTAVGRIRARIGLLDRAELVLPSGKRYLLPLLSKRLRWLTRQPVRPASVAMRLARYASPADLQLAREYILDA